MSSPQLLTDVQASVEEARASMNSDLIIQVVDHGLRTLGGVERSGSSDDVISVRHALHLLRADALLNVAESIAARRACDSDRGALFGQDKRSMCSRVVSDCDEVLRDGSGVEESDRKKALLLRAKAAALGLQHYARKYIEEAMAADTTNEQLQTLLSQFPESTHNDFECVLCARIYYEPITTSCGHTFCRPCLVHAMDHCAMTSQRCPYCRSPLHMDVANHPVTIVLANYLEKCYPEEYAARRDEAKAKLTQEDADTLTVPLFVLSLLFPPHSTTLNVFEPRYRLMIRRCLEGSRCFGVVEHANNAEGFHTAAGTLVRIRNSSMQPDGRIVIDIAAEQRFTIEEHWDLDGYHVARVKLIRCDLPETITEEGTQYVQSKYRVFQEKYPSVPDTQDPTAMSLFMVGLCLRHVASEDALTALSGQDFTWRVELLRRVLEPRWSLSGLFQRK